MTHQLISAEQARENAAGFVVTQAQIEASFAQSIDASSKRGSNSTIVTFRRAAVSQPALECVLAAVRERGFSTEAFDGVLGPEELCVRITW